MLYRRLISYTTRSQCRAKMPLTRRHGLRRLFSSSSPPPSAKEATGQAAANATSATTAAGAGPAAEKSLVDKLPKSLKPYAERFREKPASHLLSLMILHEITAVVPLGGLFYLFHEIGWTPASLFPDEWIETGEKRMEKYARSKGWDWVDGKNGAKILLELGTAYAAVKALLPLRIAMSVWATPWFARVFVIPIGNLFRKSKAAAK